MFDRWSRLVLIIMVALGALSLMASEELPAPVGQSAVKAQVVERTNPVDGAVMVFVPAGEFLRGSTEEEASSRKKTDDRYQADCELPQRKIYLDGYWMYKYEVTVGQFRKFCEATKYPFPWDNRQSFFGWDEKLPMVGVTWHDAKAYADWAGASLPTEAQWEKAARGTDGRRYPWGNDWDAEKCNNWEDHNTAGGGYESYFPSPGGSYPAGASPYGVEDMAGNVWEWCADWWQPDYYANAPAKNPPGPPNGDSRVLRGGSWYGYWFDNQDRYRCARRYSDSPDIYWYGGYGFRCVLNDDTAPEPK